MEIDGFSPGDSDRASVFEVDLVPTTNVKIYDNFRIAP